MRIHWIAIGPILLLLIGCDAHFHGTQRFLLKVTARGDDRAISGAILTVALKYGTAEDGFQDRIERHGEEFGPTDGEGDATVVLFVGTACGVARAPCPSSFPGLVGETLIARIQYGDGMEILSVVLREGEMAAGDLYQIRVLDIDPPVPTEHTDDE
jgi:hypothetical protein